MSRGSSPSPSFSSLTSDTESHNTRGNVGSAGAGAGAGAGIPNQSFSDFDNYSLLFQNIPTYSDSQQVFNNSASARNINTGNGQPASKIPSVYLSRKLKLVIEDFIRNGNEIERGNVPGGTEWMKSLFLKLKRHDTRVSFNDVLRWTRTHAWIITDSLKARNQNHNQNQSYPPNPTPSTSISLNQPLAEPQSQSQCNIGSKMRRQNDLKKCLEIKTRLLLLNDDFEESDQMRASSIMFQKLLPAFLRNLGRREKRAIMGLSWEESLTRAEQQMTTETNDDQGRGQGQCQSQGQTIRQTKVEPPGPDDENEDVDHSESDEVEVVVKESDEIINLV